MTQYFYVLVLILLFAAGIAPMASAQSPEQYFHSGARLYVDGRLGYAMEDVEAGLRLSPRDPKLLSLREMIRAAMEQQQQRPQQDDEPQHAGEPDEQDAQDAQAGDGETDEQTAGEQGDQQDDLTPEPGSEGEHDNTQPPRDGEPDRTDTPSGESLHEDGHPGMSREHAEQLLQAVEQDERDLIREAQRNRTRPRRAYPDW